MRIEQPEWLEAFVAVAETLNFSSAAIQLHKSQSRVSSHVASLERILGSVLFDRSQRPVILTDAGIAYLPYASEALQLLQDGAETVKKLSGQVSGVVVVGAHPSASVSFLVPFIARFSKLYPEVRIEPVEGTTEILTEMLQNGEVDIAIRSDIPAGKEDSLTHFPLWQEPLVALLPTRHNLSIDKNEPIEPCQLENENIVCIGRAQDRIEPEITRAFTAWGTTLNVAYITQQPQTLIHMVKHEMGIGIINEMAARTSKLDGVVKKPIGTVENARTVGVWWHSTRRNSLATRTAILEMRKTPIPAGAFAME